MDKHDGFARGIFANGRRERARVKPGTLTELRWHQALPSDGPSAEATSRGISRAVLGTLTLASVRDVEWERANEGASSWLSENADDLGAKAFVNVTTGMRLRLMRVRVILMHGLGDCAGVLSGLARSLAKRGCCVFAFDARGHGDSTPAAAADGYTPASLAADLQSLIVELARSRPPQRDPLAPACRGGLRPAVGGRDCGRRLMVGISTDLYTAPIVLCGFGAGASAALVAASERPALFAGVILCELWCPAEAPRDAMTFAYGQAAEFESPRQAAAFLSASCWGHEPRPLPAAVRHNLWRVCFPQPRLPGRLRPIDPGASIAVSGACRLRTDPQLFFRANSIDVERLLSQVRCHVRLVHGAKSHLGGFEKGAPASAPRAGLPRERARALAARASASAKSVGVHTLEGAGHFLLEDSPLELRDTILGCCAAWRAEALPAALSAAERAARTPEALGLRALPQFETLEEARRALGPRKVPTAADIAAALRVAREGDEESSDDDEGGMIIDGGNGRRPATALCNERSDYFGFVG